MQVSSVKFYSVQPLSMRKEYWSGGHFLLQIPSLNHCAVHLKLTQHCK